MGFQQLPLDGHANPYDVETIHNLVDQLLIDHQKQLNDQELAVEIDLESGDIRVPHTLFRQLLDSLIRSAICSMPAGGKMSITLIDAGTQMELAVSDTGKQRRYAESEIRDLQDELISIGGNIETWSTASSGTTRVLVFPVRRNTRFAG